ncbi:MAG: M24 family metallopeptidase [Gemmatimonadaceae bacterium]|jgi:Xaa-Pro aminopeptidase|nr:M24 family metallopeptidase [Gemmatimonadaceae bacterium]
MLTPALLPAIQQRLADLDLDGWLLYDFRGTNAIASGLLGFDGLVSRRVFAYLPREGTPIGIQHAIEPGPWARWPEAWSRVVYSGWRALESELATLVAGKRVAMEYSPGDAIPYLDRVPAGVLEMVRATGATVVSSGELVSAVYAVWSDADRASHERAAEHIRRIAHEAFAIAGERARTASPVAEHELQAFILDAFARVGLHTDHGPDCAASENAANPHYEPHASRPRLVREGDTLLIDLWARESGGVYADQTWMASIGAPSVRAVTIWDAVRDARDAALSLLHTQLDAGGDVRGADADDAARAVIEARGFGPYFTHRTGHSIDARELHGSGPQLDNLESRDGRLLIPGVGFSVEPGIYLPGEIGMRTEVNALVLERGLLVTPGVIQRDLLVL